MKKILLVLIGASLWGSFPYMALAAFADDLPAGFELQTVVTGLNMPVAARFSSDGRVFIVQKNGVVKVFKNNELLSQPFITLTDVNTYNDRGLLDLALDPDFPNTPHVYLLYTHEDNAANSSGVKTSRLVRVTAAGDVVVPGSEVVILGSIGVGSCDDYPVNSDCIPSDSGSHSIGSIRFASDGTLFIGSGDGASFTQTDAKAFRAQDLDSFAGKILHINKDGTGLPSNPFYTGNPNDNRSKVWAYGFRNPFRFDLALDQTGLFVGDVGWSSVEELNFVTPGQNYGWPCWEGVEHQGAYQGFQACQDLYAAGGDVKPLHTYTHPPGAAIVGGVQYSGINYPSSYQGVYFFADYGRNEMFTLEVDGENNLVPGSLSLFSQQTATPVHIFQGPDGDLYYISIFPGELVRLHYTFENRVPFAKITATPNGGGVPLTVQFSSAGSSDPDGDILTYHWSFGDGSFSNEQNPVHTYITAGSKTITLTVDDGRGGVTQIQTVVQPGNHPPVLNINSPVIGSSFNIGDVVAYQGEATDQEDGTLGGASLHWQGVIHHCPFGTCHTHPFVESEGANGSLVVPDHETDSFFELILTATDSGGLTVSKSVTFGLASDSGAFIGEYFNTTIPAGTPTVVRTDAVINFDWGLDSPNPIIPTDHFSVRWTRQDTFEAGIYTFSVTADDGVRLFIDDVLVIDQWHDQAALTHIVERTMTAGIHTVRLEYYENEYAASANFSYAKKNSCDAKAARVEITQYQTGDAKWRFKEIVAIPNSQYVFSNYSRSNVATEVILQVRKIDNTFAYVWLGGVAPSDSWQKNQFTFTAPADTSLISVFHVIKQVGFLDIDAYELHIETDLGTNLIADPSIEMGLQPDWTVNRWGNNDASFSYPVEGVLGDSAYCASYFNNKSLVGAPILTRLDPVINFDWGLASPDPLIGADHFSVRWQKQAEFEDALYRFIVTADDGARLFIDDIPVIDQWQDQAATTYTAERQMTPGIHPVRLEYYENEYAALANFSYEKVDACTVRGAKIELTSYVSGDAKWYHKEIPVQSGALYHFTSKYKSTVPTRIVAQFRMNDDSFQHLGLIAIPAALDWQDASAAVVAPVNASSLVFFHLIDQEGSLTIDQVSVLKNTDSVNLVENSSFEMPGPSSWTKNKWGNNIAIFTYPVDGFGLCEEVPPPPDPIIPSNNDGALVFDGVNDYVDIGAWNIEEPTFTLEAEFKVTELGRNVDLLAKATGTSANQYDWSLGLNDQNQFVFRLTTDSNVTVLTGGSFGLNETTHVAARYDGTEMRIYKNGVVVASTAKAGNIAQTLKSIAIGSNPVLPELLGLKGSLEDVRVWNIVRSDAQINETLGTSLVGSQIGLIKYWKFNENFGQDIIDNSNSGHHGRLGSTAEVDLNDPSWKSGGSTMPTTDFIPTHVETIVTDLGGGVWQIVPTIENVGSQPGHLVLNMEIYDVGGNKVHQTFYDGQTFQPGETRNFSFNWTPAVAGTYRVALGLIHLNWSGLYQWVNSAGTISVL